MARGLLPKADPLTHGQLRRLKTGDRVVVLWEGGNGPHEYEVLIKDGVPHVWQPWRKTWTEDEALPLWNAGWRHAERVWAA